ncbi:hypothetical protein WMY93_008293 [Mugilogobius chulae]|uniref:Uncharacterized protein n=1 Tax=Mugilogobius chulae TaxID=88201 RepID=A0AAW0PFW3_9GOBI
MKSLRDDVDDLEDLGFPPPPSRSSPRSWQRFSRPCATTRRRPGAVTSTSSSQTQTGPVQSTHFKSSPLSSRIFRGNSAP